nr:uncharacterized protein LOC127295657 isoform X4 [Lolium perenne]
MCFPGCLSFRYLSGRRRCCSVWPAGQAAERLRFSCRSGGFTFCSVAATSALRTGLQVNDAVLSSRGRPDSPSGHVSRGHASVSASPSDLRMDDADIAAENSKTTAVAAKGEKRRQLTSVRGSLKNKILLRLTSKGGSLPFICSQYDSMMTSSWMHGRCEWTGEHGLVATMTLKGDLCRGDISWLTCA